MAQSALVKRQKDFEKKEGYTLPAEEAEQYNLICKKIVDARNQREQPRDEFDGMSYEQAYLSNKRAAMSYLMPKKNDDEVRVNTGTTEKRIELVMNELLSLNLEGETKTFDKDDNFLEDASEVFSDIAKRTKQIERLKDKNFYYYKELITQPSLFVEELWTEQKKKSKKKTFRTRGFCESKMLQGVQVYLGDINLPDVLFNEQSYLIKYARVSYEEAERTFKDLNPEKWEYVKPGAYTTLTSVSNTLYKRGSLQNNEVEAFWYMSYPDDELQIIVQGIPFLEVGASYTKEYGDYDGYHIAMVGLNPYSWDFAYSKPLTQSAKTLQALDNETIRNLIRKFRQALEPPLGVPKGKIFSRDIWNPGQITQGVSGKDFERLIDHQGVTQSEMAMFDLIEKKTNEFIGASQQEPLQGKTQVTATEFMLAQRTAIKMLGNSVLAIMRLEDKLNTLRIKSILNHFTKPIAKEYDPIQKKVADIYARFTLENADLGDQQGTKIIQMMDRGLSPDEERVIFAEEQKAKKRGQPFRYQTINIPALMDLDLYFYTIVTAKPQESSELDKAQLTSMINQGVAISKITGRPMSPARLVEKFERVWKERDLFEKEAPMTPGMGMPGLEEAVPESGTETKLMDMMQGPKGQALSPKDIV